MTDSNSAIVESKDDQIESFQVGIAAVGGRRLPDGGTCSHNKAELNLNRMKLATKPHRDSSRFRCSWAPNPVWLFPAGDGNIVHVHVQETTGSGPRENLYADGAGFGTGNQLVFVGTLATSTTAIKTSTPPLPPSSSNRPASFAAYRHVRRGKAWPSAGPPNQHE